MITINASLSSLDTLITRLENSAVGLHRQAVEFYPDPSYEELDTAAVDCGRCIDFLLLSRNIKELELGIRQLDLELNYLTVRTGQLEQFLYKGVGQHTADLLSVISKINSDIVEKKYQRYLLENQAFQIEIPESVAVTLKNNNFLISAE